MSAMTVAQRTGDSFMLEAPEVLVPVTPEDANDRIPVSPEKRAQIKARAATFAEQLANLNFESDAFRAKVDEALRLGLEKLALSSSTLENSSLDSNFIGAEDSPAFIAIKEMRGYLDDLNPAAAGDLSGSGRIGFLRWGNRLRAYLRKYQSARKHIKEALLQVYSARDGVQKRVAEIDTTRSTLWGQMEALSEEIIFLRELDAEVAGRVESLRQKDEFRARALEQELLFYARQNLVDMQVQQSVNVNGYLSYGLLKKSARDLIGGCNRVATTGMSAMVVAQGVAKETGLQIDLANMLQGVSGSIESLVVETSRQLKTHVDTMAKFSSNPLIGVAKIQEMFNLTYQAMDTVDAYRSKAIVSLGETSRILDGELEKAGRYVDRVRAEAARSAMQ